MLVHALRRVVGGAGKHERRQTSWVVFLVSAWLQLLISAFAVRAIDGTPASQARTYLKQGAIR